MKSIHAIWLPVLLGSVGCVTLPSLKDEPVPKSVPAGRPSLTLPALELARKSRCLQINPEEVTDSNAREKASSAPRAVKEKIK